MIQTLIILTFLNETIIHEIGKLFHKEVDEWKIELTAIFTGCILAYMFDCNIFEVIDGYKCTYLSIALGTILTGFLIGRGSNVICDLINNIIRKEDQKKSSQSVIPPSD